MHTFIFHIFLSSFCFVSLVSCLRRDSLEDYRHQTSAPSLESCEDLLNTALSTSPLTSCLFVLLQEAIVKIMKMRKRITNAALQTELVEILKNMFIPQKKMIKEQIEWLIDHKYLRRDEEDINTFLYVV